MHGNWSTCTILYKFMEWSINCKRLAWKIYISQTFCFCFCFYSLSLDWSLLRVIYMKVVKTMKKHGAQPLTFLYSKCFPKLYTVMIGFKLASFCLFGSQKERKLCHFIICFLFPFLKSTIFFSFPMWASPEAGSWVLHFLIFFFLRKRISCRGLSLVDPFNYYSSVIFRLCDEFSNMMLPSCSIMKIGEIKLRIKSFSRVWSVGF